MNDLDILCAYIKKQLLDNVDVRWSNLIDFDKDTIGIRVTWFTKPKTIVGIKFEQTYLSFLNRNDFVSLIRVIRKPGRKIWLSIDDWTDRIT